MTITKRYLAELKDLKALQITCPNPDCHAAVTIPFAGQRDILPSTCPHCQKSWLGEGTDKQKLHDLFNAIKILQGIGNQLGKFQLEITAPAE